MTRDPLTLTVFGLIIALTLAITVWAGRRNKGASDHFVAHGSLTGWQNGLAIVGDLLSAAVLLGTVGLITLNGQSGYFFAVGGIVAYLFLLLVFAEPLRNLGRYTMADVVASRFKSQAIRASMAVNSLMVTVFYMVGQLVAAGSLMTLLLGVRYEVGVIVVGLLMTLYISVGGMLATSWIQIVKAGLLLVCAVLLAVLVLAKFSFNPFTLFRAANDASPSDLFSYPHSTKGSLDLLSIAIAVGLGSAAMPHILIRFLTVPDAKAARQSMNVALVLTGVAFLCVPVLGFGAAALIGPTEVAAAHPAGNLATLQLADLLGGNLLFAIVAAVAFATILAVVSGLVIAGSGTLAHDIWNSLIRKGRASDREQVAAGRITAVLLAVVCIALSLAVKNSNVTFLSAAAVVVAASANVPVLLLLLFWRRLNSTGVITGICFGLVSSVGLVLVGPLVMTSDPIYPLSYPTLVSIPLGFLGCVLGTVLSGGRRSDVSYDDLQVRAALGVSAPEPSPAATR
ncbi:solute symporter family protein [Patulibacter sp. S7RM1-6]